MEDIVSASFAVFSNASYTSRFKSDFDFANATLRLGCASLIVRLERCDTALLPRALLGEDELVVTVVVAVLGLSFEEFNTAAPDVAGIFPITSSLLIRCLISSNSSQMVDCAVVDVVDSVSSVFSRGSSASLPGSIAFEVSGDEL